MKSRKTCVDHLLLFVSSRLPGRAINEKQQKRRHLLRDHGPPPGVLVWGGMSGEVMSVGNDIGKLEDREWDRAGKWSQTGHKANML